MVKHFNLAYLQYWDVTAIQTLVLFCCGWWVCWLYQLLWQVTNQHLEAALKEKNNPPGSACDAGEYSLHLRTPRGAVNGNTDGSLVSQDLFSSVNIFGALFSQTCWQKWDFTERNEPQAKTLVQFNISISVLVYLSCFLPQRNPCEWGSTYWRAAGVCGTGRPWPFKRDDDPLDCVWISFNWKPAAAKGRNINANVILVLQ